MRPSFSPFLSRCGSRTAEGSSAILGIIAVAGCQVPLASGASEASPGISFTREMLENGLTVIFHEDHRLPLVVVNTWYFVGSKDEVKGRSGFAHLFEHLMFMGTRRVPGGEFDRTIEGAGGSNNASTSADRTNYFDEASSNLLETLLYLEADRMEGFGRAIDQEKLDTQRRVVQNERRQSYENRPYGRAALEKWKLMYPPGHPYHEPVIGSHQDLESATVDDVQAFFARYYVPRNASLVVAGDFQTAEARELVRKYYGRIPPGTAAPRREPIPVSFPREKRETIPDRVQLPRVSFLYHSPALFQEGDADLDIAASILGDGKASRLYRALVYEKKLAQEVATFQSSHMLGSFFEIQVTARPGQDLDALEEAMDLEISKLLQEPPSAHEVERARNDYEVDFWRSIEPLGDRADLLNQYLFFLGEPDGIARDLGRYRAVTPQSVQKWSQKVLGPKARLVLRVLPQDQLPAGPLPPEGAPAPAPPTSRRPAEPEAEDLLPPRPPSAGPPRPFEPPLPAVSSLPSGIPLWVLRSTEVPLVTLSLVVRGAGAASDPPEKSGLAALAASMLDEGAGSRGALEIADELDLLGATLSAFAGRERAELRLTVLKRNLDRALDIFADVLLRPRFDPREWERVKTLTLNELLQRRDNPAAVGRVVVERSFFGNGHPYAAPIAGYADSVRSIELEDVGDFFRSRYRPSAAAVAAAGDISLEEIVEKLESRLSSWKSSEASPLVLPPPSLPGESRRAKLMLVEKPGAPQTVISLAGPGIARTDPNYPELLLASTIFGGSFTSRLNQNLREEHEFTYGAGSNFHRLKGPGAFLILTSVKTDTTGEALVEIARECRGMAAGLRPGELEKARATARTQAMDPFSTVSGIAETLAQLLDLGLPPHELRWVLKRVDALSEADVEKAARRVIRWEGATVVLVGDRQALEVELTEAEGKLRALGGEDASLLPRPLFVDADGNPLGDPVR